MIEVLKQALEALEAQGLNVDGSGQLAVRAKYDLRQAIAELESQEPAAWCTFDGEGQYEYRAYEDNESYADDWAKRNPNHKGWVDPLYTHPPQRTEQQEPLIPFRHGCKWCGKTGACEHSEQPPQRTEQEPFEFWSVANGWETIATSEQKPFGYVNRDEVVEHMGLVSCGTIYRHPAEGRLALYTHPPQPEQEPPLSAKQAYAMAQVCLDLHDALGCKWGDNPYLTISQLKASQQQRTWVGLTDEEMMWIYGQDREGSKKLGRKVEAKLKEKNT